MTWPIVVPRRAALLRAVALATAVPLPLALGGCLLVELRVEPLPVPVDVASPEAENFVSSSNRPEARRLPGTPVSLPS